VVAMRGALGASATVQLGVAAPVSENSQSIIAGDGE
jgi:hypothetical protein